MAAKLQPNQTPFQGKQTYFRPQQENFLVWLPLIAFLFVFLELLGTPLFQFNSDGVEYRVLLNVFFLNSIHLICPFLILAFWPSGRAYVKRKMANRRFLFLTLAALSALFVFAVLLVSVNSFKDSPSLSSRLLTSSLLWIWAMVPLAHSLRQSLGISILMSKSVEQTLPLEKKSAFQVFFKKERLVMNTFCLTMLATIGCYFSDWNGKQRAAIAFAIVSFALAVLIVYRIYKEDQFKDTNKLLFSAKFLMWPFLPFSVVALTTITFCHALEYFGLMQKSAGEYNLPVKKISIAIGIFTLFILFFEIRRFFVGPGEYYLTSQPLFFAFLICYPVLALAHYATDSVIYRFRDPDVRESFGDFLVSFEKRTGK